jgi:geranylgeranyl diphosphate synthase type II
MFDLKSYLNARKDRIESRLLKIFDTRVSQNRVCDAMRYSLMAGGKRIRPILCLASAEAVSPGGVFNENVLIAACALEMIHTYSLIHDDLPAMDDDYLRRGKKTCHVAYDEATAILAGDALLTLAFETLSAPEMKTSENSAIWITVIQVIARAAGIHGMIKGQMIDIISEGSSMSVDELKAMHSLKTGAMIEASVYSGALLAGGNSKEIDSLREYARNIGLAFQVTDDILNVEGDSALMGKAVGTDEQKHKNTYPSLLGLEISKEFAKKLVFDALQSLEIFDERSAPLKAIAGYIIDRKR